MALFDEIAMTLTRSQQKQASWVIERNYEPRYGHAGATFDHSGVFRYALYRVWDVALPLVNFCCLNPSTADASQLDPTLKKCAKYARRWGFGGIVVTNVFALRSTDPKNLKTVKFSPIGERNDWFIGLAASVCAMVICAWGQHATLHQRSATVMTLLTTEEVTARKLHYLKRTKEPWHPLYLRDDLNPVPWH